MSERDSRDFQIHRSDAHLRAHQPLKLDGGALIEVENWTHSEIIEESV